LFARETLVHLAVTSRIAKFIFKIVKDPTTNIQRWRSPRNRGSNFFRIIRPNTDVELQAKRAYRHSAWSSTSPRSILRCAKFYI